MKIAILTQPLVNNYGGILQNYALQRVLIDCGHSVTTLNFSHQFKDFNIIFFTKEFSKRIIKKLLGQKIISLNPYKEEKRTFYIRPFQREFIKKYINKIDLYKAISSEDRHFINMYDAFIVGSDQIWRPLYSPNLKNFFLDFLCADCTKVKISYAASFGTDQWEINPAVTSEIIPLAKSFNGISVREESGVALCKTQLDVEAVHVLDPTLLLSSGDYEKLVEEKGDTGKSKNYIGTYILDDSKLKKSLINEIGQKTGLAVKILGSEIKEYEKQSIEDWLLGIRDAGLIVTDSFHGTVFSIIFHTPFITIYNKERGNSRLESLLKMFGLENRLVDGYDEEVIASEIDWEDVDEKLENLRAKSLQFLKLHLSNGNESN